MIRVMFVCHGRTGREVLLNGFNTAFVGQNVVDSIGDYYGFTTNKIIVKIYVKYRTA